ncbi:uncharacterized protein LOC122085074 [Macadamia integrifolia]|uniref:uncharacterized protein LOC122085074 n=1 Tax=Macadamia integrifolia TaxID=60698 RepID=UPI001C4F4A57|nr:uncharacterized protein LOC122085074 [Macadamia integrifolia]XP_042509448.1 uncharacterized protein LOC122085074 [Macadamia integrifolia]XP_042509449.1 uncharacterized protein LOC122085074 [Macadamia integrifolia]XP_042509450.1 uncharacterized protein LOC122085074 [Macadamia integrifolia]
MVQQMIDPKTNDLGLSNKEHGLPRSDKQQLSVKKTALRDLQNDNILRPKPLGNSHFLKDRGSTMAAVKVSGIKRTTPECPTSPSGLQSSSNNNANGHLVYVRRKSESEIGKSSTCEIMENSADCPPLRQLNHGEQGTSRQQIQMKDSKISCFPAFAPIPMAPPMIFSSGGPTVPLSLGKSGTCLSLAESNCPAVSSAVPFLASPPASNEPWRERSLRLQTFLRNCDHSSQEEYIQMLRSLSAAGRSKEAVELEKRAIHLLLEEGRELHRMKTLNVLGKSTQKSIISPFTQAVQSEM